MNLLPTEVKDSACKYWHNNKNVTLEEAAQAYGISRATLSRALRERGLSDTYVNYKTVEESRMLNYLKRKGINTLGTLQVIV